jgi:DNA-binding NarL/FixJ family response regulator
MAITQPDGTFTLELRPASPKPPAQDIRAAGSVVANDGDELASLTPREREVLRLLAEGLSNRQIADALYIAPRTASTHVGNILSKLGLASRTEAATRALRRGLSPTSHNNGVATAI